MISPGRFLDVLPLHHNESPESFIARLVRANSFRSLGEYSSFTGHPRFGFAAMENEALAHASMISGVKESHLTRFAIRTQDLFAFGAGTVKRTQLRGTQNRYCPHCFADDLRDQSGDVATRIYMRASWRWNVVANCHIHHTPLQELSSDFDALDLQEYASADVLRTPSEEVSAHTTYFCERLLGKQTSTFIDTLPMYVAAEFCAVLGSLERSAIDQKPNDRVLQGMSNQTCLSAGFKIAVDGLDAITTFLDRYVRAVVGKSTSHPMVYSLPLRWLRKETDEGDYGSLRRLFQKHAEANLPLEPGSIFLTRVERRRVHTSVTASREYGIAEGRIRDVLLKYDENDSVITTFGSRSIFFRRDRAHQMLLATAAQITSSKAASLLGCAMTQMEQLLNAGLIAFTTLGEPGTRLFRWIDPAELSRFQDTVHSKVNVVPKPSGGMLPILKATKRCHRNFAQIVELIVNDRIQFMESTSETIRLDHLFVDPIEIDDVNKASKDGRQLTRAQVAVALGTRAETVKDIFVSGLIEVTRALHEKSRHPIEVTTEKELDRFVEEFVVLDVVARERGVPALTIRLELEAKTIFPVIAGSAKASKVYRRSELCRALL